MCVPAVSTAFDLKGAAQLEKFKPAALKVAAPDLFNPELIKKDLAVCAGRGIPFFCSAALGRQKDLQLIVDWAEAAGAQLAFTIGPKLYDIPLCMENSGVETHEYIAANYGIERIKKLSQAFPDIPLGISDHSCAFESGGLKFEGHEMLAAAAFHSTASFAIITAGASVDKGKGNIEAAYAASLREFSKKVKEFRRAVSLRQKGCRPSVKMAAELEKAVGFDKGPRELGPSQAEGDTGEWGTISWAVAKKRIRRGKKVTTSDFQFCRIYYPWVPAEDRKKLLPRAALSQILGNCTTKEIRAGQYLTVDSFKTRIEPEKFECGPRPEDHPEVIIG